MRTVLISDFNVDPLRTALDVLNETEDAHVRLEATCAPFGSVMQSLASRDAEAWKAAPQVAVIWTRPEAVIDSFRAALEFDPHDTSVVLGEVEQFGASLLRSVEGLENVFVPSWVLATHRRGYGLLERQSGKGIADLLARMNLRLADTLASAPNVYMLDAGRWIEKVGASAFSSKMWYLAKVPFDTLVFSAAAAEIHSACRTLSGKSRKLIVVDLDNTLWGGTVGEDGWEQLELGGHSATGEAYLDFQKGLRALARRGIALGIVSKNTESVAIEAIQKHPEMALRLDDFAGWRINWNDKAGNILELVAELNLGLDSVVFVDDQPAERARVRAALPDVFVPEWPVNRMLYLETLMRLDCFDTVAVTAEDRERNKMYFQERERRAVLAEVRSVDDWLRDLQLKIRAEVLNEASLPRAAQLLNKTNQMNMATRRMSESDFWTWAQADNHRVWTFRVSDRFGDAGLTGIISLESDGEEGRIVDLLLSCRVVGRRIEDAMIHTALCFAAESGLRCVTAVYEATERNQPCLEFLRRTRLESNAEGRVFTWTEGRDVPIPDAITLVIA